MLDLVIRGTLILVFAFAAAGVMRRASAAARHLLWASALAGLLVLPAVVRLGPAVHVPVPMLVSAATPAPDPEPAALAEPTPAAEPEFTVVRTRTHTRVRSHEHMHHATTPVATPAYAAPSATAYVVADEMAPEAARIPETVRHRVGIWQRAWDARWAIWAAGVLLVLGRLLLGMARVRAIVREAVPVTDPEWLSLLSRVAHPLGVYRRVTLRVGPEGAVPVTCGILAPVIILPEDAEDWDDERRALVLTHELAHVRRLDVLTHIIGQCAVALFWFHPLAWLAAARMRLERERACDDLVLGSGARPSRYAGDLLDLVQTLNGPTAPAAAALAMARRTEIEGRLLSILDAAVRRGPLGARRIAGALVVAAFGIVTIAAVRPVATPPADAAPDRTVVALPAVSALADAPQATTARPVVRVAGGGWTNNYVALADIAEAAATIASDAAKRQVLFEIGQRYGVSDTLRHAFFGAINTMASSTERRRVLLALVGRGDRDEQTLIEVVRSAGKMASDHDKGGVLRTVAGLDQLTDPALRHEFFAAVATMASSSERTRVLLAVLGEARARGRASPTQNAMIARLALNAATELPSSSDKVRVLRAVVHGGWLSDAAVSHDFNICLTTLGGGVDYHYVVSGGGD
ncbi:MAG TPA: M56 family metallopeptidase [Gemmatimonadaceae bacterium]|nr:M56 family metallopeptidase [Gemmatimonadaceae bacterium]